MTLNISILYTNKEYRKGVLTGANNMHRVVTTFLRGADTSDENAAKRAQAELLYTQVVAVIDALCFRLNDTYDHNDTDQKVIHDELEKHKDRLLDDRNKLFEFIMKGGPGLDEYLFMNYDYAEETDDD